MDNTKPDLFDTIGAFFTRHPAYFGVFITAAGVMFIAAAIMNAEWLFGDARSWNLSKVDGWVNFFGRTPARYMVGAVGVALILAGILLTVIAGHLAFSSINH